ncbi:MAG: DUF7852 domain-containing protein [Desulfocucumaceae bacterium]
MFFQHVASDIIFQYHIVSKFTVHPAMPQQELIREVERNMNNRLYSSIPVIIGEIKVQFDVPVIVELPEETLEIKKVNKKLNLTKCQWLNDEPSPDGKDTLLLEGFIEEIIDYSAPNSRGKSNLSGIAHCIADVPFKYSTEIEEYKAISPICVALNDMRHSRLSQCGFEYFNQLPLCQLASGNICENDSSHNPVYDTSTGQQTFTRLSDKTVIQLNFKLLQNQKVIILPVS